MTDVTLGDRLLRVAISGHVPDDDPHIIADAQARIDELEKELNFRRSHPLHCAAARPGEMTLECRADDPCAPCQARATIEWRPIASALKDGRDILLLLWGESCSVAAYDTTPPGSETYPWAGEECHYHRDAPTHWMQLPSRPGLTHDLGKTGGRGEQ